MSQSKIALAATALSALLGTGYYISNKGPKSDVRRAEFEEFKLKHQKVYGSLAEEERRFEAYADNMDYIEMKNAQNLTYKLGENQLADLSYEEFSQQYLGLDVEQHFLDIQNHPDTIKFESKYKEGCPKPPVSFDLEAEGRMTPVKSQGGCGSCLIFATTAVMESNIKTKFGQDVILQEQFPLDCQEAKEFGQNGCNGGNPYRAPKFYVEYGHVTHAGYPIDYQAKESEACHIDRTQVEYKNKDFILHHSDYDPAKFIEGLETYGALSTAVFATRDFSLYKEGIFDEEACNNGSINHAVVTAGYGEDEDGKFWKIKNSWGTWYGENGYIRVKRVDDVTQYASCSNTLVFATTSDVIKV